MASPQVVTYALDDGTPVRFEIEPGDGFVPAGVGDGAGLVREAVDSAVQAARAVLDRMCELGPDRVQVTFGVKVTGTANWLVARAATEGNFQVTMSWAPDRREDAGDRS